MRANAEAAIARFAVAGATPSRAARLLSGGNAQKLVLARELGEGLEVLVAHSPTRGLDVGGLCRHSCRPARRGGEYGAAILLISEDLEEVLALSDRIVVMSRGPHRRRGAAGRCARGHRQPDARPCLTASRWSAARPSAPPSPPPPSPARWRWRWRSAPSSSSSPACPPRASSTS
ncbi:MAG: hypothetical protein U0797_31840 [Gemmataceae bacterium]